MRSYHEPHRGTPLRRPSPPPLAHAAPSIYPGQGLPQPGPIQPQQQSQPNRISNPNYGAPPPAGVVTPPGSHPSAMPPPGRAHSPPPEIKPITDDRVSSPNSSLPHLRGAHQGFAQPSIMSVGPPPAAFAAADAAAREREERPPTGFKRNADSEDDYKTPNKKSANGDSRGRLEDHSYRRPSPTERPMSPGRHQRRSSSEIRREQANQNYHPSEAAHHPPTLPAMQHQSLDQPPQSQHLPPMSETPREERRETYEPARRKVEVDEDYDDAPDGDKPAPGPAGRSSPPRGPSMNGQPKQEP